MPSNVVIVNGQEFNVPDSWMPVLWDYLQLMQFKTGQSNPNYGVQVDPPPSDMSDDLRDQTTTKRKVGE